MSGYKGIRDCVTDFSIIIANIEVVDESLTMIATPITEQIPIRIDQDGRFRVGHTRVLLDLVIYSFQLGQTPETITDQYPVLSLDDVYLAIGYYLRHRDQVDHYLRTQEAEAEAFRHDYEAHHPPTRIREVLMARLAAKQNVAHE